MSRYSIQTNCSLDVLKYGTQKATNNVTTFGRVNVTALDSPSLDITIHHIPIGYLKSINEAYGLSRDDVSNLRVQTPNDGELNLIDKTLPVWTNIRDATSSYEQAYMENHGKCQPTVVR